MRRILLIEVDETGAIEIRADWVPETSIEVMGILRLAREAVYQDWIAGRLKVSSGRCEFVQPAVATIRVHPTELPT